MPALQRWFSRATRPLRSASTDQAICVTCRADPARAIRWFLTSLAQALALFLLIACSSELARAAVAISGQAVGVTLANRIDGAAIGALIVWWSTASPRCRSRAASS